MSHQALHHIEKATLFVDESRQPAQSHLFEPPQYCDSYNCPYGYELVDDADDIKCKNYKCTKKQCCEKGEKPS